MRINALKNSTPHRRLLANRCYSTRPPESKQTRRLPSRFSIDCGTVPPTCPSRNLAEKRNGQGSREDLFAGQSAQGGGRRTCGLWGHFRPQSQTYKKEEEERGILENQLTSSVSENCTFPASLPQSLPTFFRLSLRRRLCKGPDRPRPAELTNRESKREEEATNQPTSARCRSHWASNASFSVLTRSDFLFL